MAEVKNVDGQRWSGKGCRATVVGEGVSGNGGRGTVVGKGVSGNGGRGTVDAEVKKHYVCFWTVNFKVEAYTFAYMHVKFFALPT